MTHYDEYQKLYNSTYEKHNYFANNFATLTPAERIEHTNMSNELAKLRSQINPIPKRQVSQSFLDHVREIKK